jgi:RNA polymerase sigma-32 factor
MIEEENREQWNIDPEQDQPIGGLDVPKDEGYHDERYEDVIAVEPAADHSDEHELVRYDPLRHYLFEISKYDPLTHEDEQRLARLFREKQDLGAARKLVRSNLKLVVKIAFLYNKVYSNLMDLIQEGNIGLLQAVRRFDPERGARLPTYASWWIKAYIIKFILDNFRIVKVGTTNDRRKVLMNLRKERQRLERQGITATSKAVAEALDVSEEDVVAVEKSVDAHDVSLDEKVSSDSNVYLLETLASTEQLIDEKLAAGELKQFIEEKFEEFANTLPKKELTILQKRLIAEDPLTLQAIADQYGVTREAIRISEKKLVEKIKSYMKKALGDVRDIDFQLGE